MTMTGSVARNDHAFFMACVKAPNNRYNMVHRLAEKLEAGGREYVLSLRNLPMAAGRRDTNIFLNSPIRILRSGDFMREAWRSSRKPRLRTGEYGCAQV